MTQFKLRAAKMAGCWVYCDAFPSSFISLLRWRSLTEHADRALTQLGVQIVVLGYAMLGLAILFALAGVVQIALKIRSWITGLIEERNQLKKKLDETKQEREDLRQENEELIDETDALKKKLEAQPSTLLASWEEWEKTPLTPIEGKTYRNEPVPLDGFHYIDCTFINPTFVYKGEKPFRFKNSVVKGSANVDARTPPLQMLLGLLRSGDALHPEVIQYEFDD